MVSSKDHDATAYASAGSSESMSAFRSAMRTMPPDRTLASAPRASGPPGSSTTPTASTTAAETYVRARAHARDTAPQLCRIPTPYEVTRGTTRGLTSPTVTARDLFLLDPEVVYLNHGSFGACPRPVFDVYQEWQRELEREPVDLLARRLRDELARVRVALGEYVGRAREISRSSRTRPRR